MNDKIERHQLLNDINVPEDLRKLKVSQLPEVCKELRDDIIKEVSCNPGHFAASLGTVELTVALHYVFQTPYDRIVWDVGHQAYGHKILTGRREAFSTNRKLGGIRPFPSPLESEYDTFACGHASNSISAALGMAVAAQIKGETDRHVVAVIGDGSMSGGLAFEGLNNVSSHPNDLLIILNDNNMSIDNSVGGMKEYLLNLTTTEGYNNIRYKASKVLQKMGLMDDDRRKSLIRLGNSLKSTIAQQQNIFEGMNIRYFGPINGHDVQNLVRVLKQLKEMKGPKLLHLHTKKGKGFEPAEKNPAAWHAAGKFDPKTGEQQHENTQGLPPRFQEVFGHTLVELAHLNPGGLAKEGLQPFLSIYSSFMQRAFDNIVHDIALLSLPVVICLDRAGLVGEDGPTHHGMLDMAILRTVPNLTIASPMNEHELRRLMYTAQLPGKGPFVIRYPRGRGVLADWRCALEEVPVGKGRCLKEGTDMAVLSIGPIGYQAIKAIEQAEAETGMSIAHYDMRFVKPLDEELLTEVGQRFKRIITLEDGALTGGMGSAVLEFMSAHGFTPKVERLGIPDCFVEHGKVSELYKLCGIDAESILGKIKKLKD